MTRKLRVKKLDPSQIVGTIPDTGYTIVTHFRAGQWRWNLVEYRNGKIVADSGERYKRHVDMVHVLVKMFPTVAFTFGALSLRPTNG